MADMNRVVVIGGGPGGYEAALVAAQLGADVTVVDPDGLGGSAVLTDCVPEQDPDRHRRADGRHGGGRRARVVLDAPRRPALAQRPRRPGRVNARVKALAAGPVRRHRPPPRARGRAGRSGPGPHRGRERLGHGARRVVAELADGGEESSRRTPCWSPPARPRARCPTAQPDGERILYLGPGLRPRRAAREADRGRLRGHRRGVRQRLPRARCRGDARVQPRPGAAGRGRRRRRGARGGLRASGHDGAVQVAHGVGDPVRATP